MRLIRTTGLLMLGFLAGGAFAENAALVFDDQPGAELHLGTPAFAPEGLCKSNMASDSGCAFKTVLVEIDGESFTPSTIRRVYRLSPGKHTIVVKPGEKLSVDITAEAVGDWAFHCHLLYHMHAGMFRVVSVRGHGKGIA